MPARKNFLQQYSSRFHAGISLRRTQPFVRCTAPEGTPRHCQGAISSPSKTSSAVLAMPVRVQHTRPSCMVRSRLPVSALKGGSSGGFSQGNIVTAICWRGADTEHQPCPLCHRISTERAKKIITVAASLAV